MFHSLAFQPFSKIARDVTRSIVAKQPRLVTDVNLVTAKGPQSQIQRVGHIFGPHVGAEFPRDDVAAVITEDRAEILDQRSAAR